MLENEGRPVLNGVSIVEFSPPFNLVNNWICYSCCWADNNMRRSELSHKGTELGMVLASQYLVGKRASSAQAFAWSINRYFNWWPSQLPRRHSVTRLVTLWVNRSLVRPVTRLVHCSLLGWSVFRSVDLSLDESIDRSSNRLVNQLLGRPVVWSIDRSVDRSLGRSIAGPIDRSVNCAENAKTYFGASTHFWDCRSVYFFNILWLFRRCV